MPPTKERESSEMPPSAKTPYGEVSSFAPAAAGASAAAANTRLRATRPRTLLVDRPKIALLVVIPRGSTQVLGNAADSNSRTQIHAGNLNRRRLLAVAWANNAARSRPFNSATALATKGNSAGSL